MNEDFTNEQGFCTDALIGYLILGMKKMDFSYLKIQLAIEGVKAALKEYTVEEAKEAYNDNNELN